MATQQQITDFLATNKVAISNDPLTGLQRKVNLESFIWKPKQNIMLQCSVEYYEDGILVETLRLKPYERILSTGGLDDEIGEYNYFVNVANGDINIFSLIYDTILLRDSQLKFDI